MIKPPIRGRLPHRQKTRISALLRKAHSITVLVTGTFPLEGVSPYLIPAQSWAFRAPWSSHFLLGLPYWHSEAPIKAMIKQGVNRLNQSFFTPPSSRPGGVLIVKQKGSRGPQAIFDCVSGWGSYLQGLTQAVGIFYRCGSLYRDYLAIDFLGGFLFVIHSEKSIYTDSKEFFIFF